ncbi:RNI-like protein [Trametes meyenii]|nr:RNI-like protein [Trametes meyenii]
MSGLEITTERTPLLPPHNARVRSPESSDRAEVNGTPKVGTFAAGISLERLSSYAFDDLHPPELALSSRASRTAFALCVLLYYRKSLSSGSIIHGRDVWTQWHEKNQHATGIRDLDSLAVRVWALALEDQGTAEDVEDVLWSPYPIGDYSTATVRVIDFLASGDAPEQLMTHPLVEFSLLDTWKYGRNSVRDGDDVISTLRHFFDRCGTPRVIYIVSLILHILYLAVSFNYVNNPPSRSDSVTVLDMRLIFLAFYGVSKLLQPWSLSTILSFSFCWEIILLHFPVERSMLLLFRAHWVLPLAVLMQRALSTILAPALFFLPGAIASFILLEATFWNWNFWLSTVPLANTLGPVFKETQVNIFILFLIFLGLSFLTLAYAVFVFPFIAAVQDTRPSPWDRFSESVGLQARLAFVRAVRTFGAEYYFPAPLNLFQVLMAEIPRHILTLVGGRTDFEKRLMIMDKVLWRILVGPLAFVLSGFTRRKSEKRSGQPPAKRRKIGDWQPDDDIPIAQAQANAPSAAALSERVIPSEHTSTLVTICTRVFAENLQRLSQKQTIWENVRLWLKELPDPLAQKVFAALKRICPTLLQHGFIVAYFLRGPSIVLGDDLPGVSKLTVFAIGDMSTRDQLRELELTGFAKIPDTAFASIVSKLPALRKLNLRGCIKVGQKTVEAMAKCCPLLEVVNLNYTSISPASLAPLLLNCKNVEVLKVAGIANWLWATLGATEDFQLDHLRSLKVRQAALSDTVLNPVLAVCPNLRRLDLSFTLAKRPMIPASHLLEKLVLTSTKISSSDLLTMLAPLNKINVLVIGAMGGGQGSSAAISNTSAMTLTDETLCSLTEILEGCPDLERVSLVGNSKLGFTGRRGPDAALAHFIRRVGRRCKHLNLAGITSLRSSDLEGLAYPDDLDEGSPRLTHLNLNNTSVDDTAAPYISACVQLQTLELAGTKFTSAGVFPIVDACERLEKLDLTSCRGVRVGDRRRFFEVWEEEWKNT